MLVTGATGFIGRALADALLRRGHQVIRAARDPGPAHHSQLSLRVDFSTVPSARWWSPRLAGVQVVVNAVGILRAARADLWDWANGIALLWAMEPPRQRAARC